jgi:hypothetical protein
MWKDAVLAYFQGTIPTITSRYSGKPQLPQDRRCFSRELPELKPVASPLQHTWSTAAETYTVLKWNHRIMHNLMQFSDYISIRHRMTAEYDVLWFALLACII